MPGLSRRAGCIDDLQGTCQSASQLNQPVPACLPAQPAASQLMSVTHRSIGEEGQREAVPSRHLDSASDGGPASALAVRRHGFSLGELCLSVTTPAHHSAVVFANGQRMVLAWQQGGALTIVTLAVCASVARAPVPARAPALRYCLLTQCNGFEGHVLRLLAADGGVLGAAALWVIAV